MPRLTWDEVATRFFEVGITRGVVYVMKDIINDDDISDYNYGVSWNGLISVDVNHEGFEATNFSNDGEIYATLRTPETISGTIEAYSYPIQFKPCDGVNVASNGVYISQQDRIPFGLCFRTEIGNDVDNPGDAGYIIHVLYGCVISPASTNYESTNPCEYSWEFTTDPSKIKGYSPFSEVLFDSRYIPSENMQVIEDTLYGTESSYPILPKLELLLKIADTGEFIPYPFAGTVEPLSINQNGIYSAPSGYAYSPVTVTVPQTTIEGLSVTENGVYTAPTGYAYSPITVNVEHSGGSSNQINDAFTSGHTVDVYCPDVVSAPSYMLCPGLGVKTLDFPICSYIGSSAFANCLSLTEISFPVCSYIGDYAFSGCSSLANVSFPVCSYIGSSAFANCLSLTEVSFPVCSYIGSYAFSGCSSLTEVSFPACSYIGRAAFSSCSSLTSVSFPVCSYIGYSAFSDCSSLTSVSFPVCNRVEAGAFRNCTSLQSADFPVCSYIGSYAFSGCSSLTNASFPVCSYIGYSAFANCLSLTSVSFPVCSYIGSYAFRSCSSLTNASFPVCSYIGSGAFADCLSLTEVSFPVCSYILPETFRNCTSLQSASFPVCSYIGYGAFADCLSLTEVSFPACSYIGRAAFSSCSSLTNASFPLCSYIDYGAFEKCISLSKIVLNVSVVCSLWAEDILYSTPMQYSHYLGYFGSIYVPESLVSSYKIANGWSYYSDRITAIVE